MTIKINCRICIPMPIVNIGYSSTVSTVILIIAIVVGIAIKWEIRKHIVAGFERGFQLNAVSMTKNNGVAILDFRM